MVEVGILGATGYAGLELTRILLQHPKVSALHASSVSFEGQSLEDVYPSMINRVDSRVVQESSSPLPSAFPALPSLQKAEEVIGSLGTLCSRASLMAMQKRQDTSVSQQTSILFDISAVFASAAMKRSSNNGMAHRINIQNCMQKPSTGYLSSTVAKSRMQPKRVQCSSQTLGAIPRPQSSGLCQRFKKALWILAASLSPRCRALLALAASQRRPPITAKLQMPPRRIK